VAYAAEAGLLSREGIGDILDLIPPPNSDKVIAEDLTDALWKRIEELISEGGSSGGAYRTGKGYTGRSIDYSTNPPLPGTNDYVFSTPFPNRCLVINIGYL
jgi:hypothetical protein